MLARKQFLKLNPKATVKFQYHEYQLQIPFSHDYPFNLQSYPAYSQNLGTIARIIQGKYPKMNAIDVGANIGDSAAIINHYAKMPVLCVEGNETFLPILKKNTDPIANVSIASCFVGETNEQVVAVNYLGTSRLEASASGTAIKTMDQVLTDFPEFKAAKLLKIDTDGFDNKIIRASKNYLATASPVIFFEYDPYYLEKQNEKGYDIFAFLLNLGYAKAVLFDNLGNTLCEIRLGEEQILADLTHYFNRNGSIYMDICVLHQQDEDLIPAIKKA
jgi:FkbM family methyltransferase